MVAPSPVAVGNRAGPSADRLLREICQGLPTEPHVVRQPARPGITADWPQWAQPELIARYQAQGVNQLWQHQRDAADQIHAGTATVVSTGTASGKSLTYTLPAISTMLAGSGTALYCTPTKALAQDQLKSVTALVSGLDRPIGVATYDGDTPTESRAWVRRNTDYLLTNPDMLHRGLLPNHPAWRSFLARLEYLIIDEAHTYRGVFGAHMAAIVRRLRRIAAHYGAEPTLVATSATIANPESAASALFGVPAKAVTQDTTARGEFALALVEPAVPGQSDGDADEDADADADGDADADADADQSASSFALTAGVLSTLTDAGARSLGFIRARKGAEAMAETLKERVKPQYNRQVMAYRGGLLPEERRDIEQRLMSGALRTVATTNALEVGVDISGLDAVVLCGWPGTRASFLQQTGRAGRNGEDAVAVLVATANPLDRFIVRNPERVFSDPIESTILDPTNPHVLLPHIAAAIGELPMLDDPAAWFGETAPDLIDLLVRRGWVRKRADGWFWTSKQDPAALADIRGSGGGLVAISERATGRLLGTVDAASAPANVHEGAVYPHLGTTYLVADLDLTASVALVDPVPVDYSTRAKTTTGLRIIATRAQHPQGAGIVASGDVEVTSQVVGFTKHSLRGQFLGLTPLDLPETRLNTRAVWWQLPADTLTRAGVKAADIPGAVHAAEHAAIGILPGLATCDRWDLGGLSSAAHPQTGSPTIFVYDGQQGGAGISDHGFANLTEWLGATRDVIASCACDVGCPGCVQSPKCGNGNEPLHKAAAITVLDLILRPTPP
ncbi:MAG: DEAD/DEAH box helicase [Actinomycetia bacterium]|nr:DEAD/DEAH box helicase [Actinomycetes bacterium]